MEIDKNKLILYGILGIQDPLRESVFESINQCKQAGINVKMITGDNAETAFAIAKSCGIISESIPKQDIDK